MGDVVAGETIKVFGLEPVLISHLDAVRPAFREIDEEWIQYRNEVLTMLVV
jgi:hypothetical protein